MLLENPCPSGAKESDSAQAKPFPKVRRFMSDQEYYDFQEAERKEEDARILEEAEPIVSAIERRLHQEHILVRILVESGIREDVLRGLLDRRAPRDNFHQEYNRDSRAAALVALASWLQADKQRRKTTPGHAPTPTLKAIYSILVEAMDFGLLSVIVGNYGIGKSRSAEVLVDERPRSRHQAGAVLIELRRDDNTVQKCIETMLKRLRHDSHGEGGYAELCRLLRPGDLVILDEAQRLALCGNGAMVEIVRDLWKDTGAGIALIGNPIMKKGGDGIIGNDLYGAFLSRAELHDFTRGTTRPDVEAWMLWKGLSGKALADKLVALATAPSRDEYGGLRRLEKLCEAVERRHPGEPLTAELIVKSINAARTRS